MKAKFLKKFFDELTPEQLNQDVVYNSKNNYISGHISDIKIQSVDLFYTSDDDPAELYTLNQLKKAGYEDDEIEEMDIEISKGSIVIEF